MKITTTTPNLTALEELGARLARIRKQQGFTQQQLSKQAGVGVATLRRIEDGKDAQIGSWVKLLRALGMVSAINDLLPEGFSSPMAEVKAAGRRKCKNSSLEEGADEAGVGKSGQEGKVVWGDEQ